jgi:two-component system, OmpR family, phosphate regulon sensor histidine kinase PhoR
VTLRGRIVLFAGAIVLASFLAAGWWVRDVLESPRAALEMERLRRDFDLVQILLEPPSASELSRLPYPELARELGARLSLRVTLVGLDGRVLGDSGIPDGDVRLMEFHGDRPEIRQAIDLGGIHELERRSPTEGRVNLYVAGILTSPQGRPPVVLRLSAPKEQLLGSYARTPTVLLVFGAVGLLALFLAVSAVHASLLRGLAVLEERILALTDGRAPTFASPNEDPLPELRGITDSLARLAEESAGRGREMARERSEILALVESIAEGVVALTEDARVLRMNRAAATLLEILPPPPFAPIGTLIRHPGLRDHLEEAVVLPLPPREFPLGDRMLRVSTSLLESGGAVVTLLDVTDLRRMEQIRRDFVANASHELKTPLTAMRGFSETLLEGDVPEPLRDQFLGSIRSNTIRMQNLVDDLLDLSRIESGSWTLQEEEVDVGSVVREVWADSFHASGGRTLGFEVTGDAVALADAQALHQILRNLLDNAVRYTPDGGVVRVRILPRGPEVQVAVEDTGSGIPSSALPRIFERFYRADPGRDRGAGGTGLGLAIVRHLVTAMGGEVSAESRLGEGTTIRFTLPRVDPPAQP